MDRRTSPINVNQALDRRHHTMFHFVSGDALEQRRAGYGDLFKTPARPCVRVRVRGVGGGGVEHPTVVKESANNVIPVGQLFSQLGQTRIG